MSQVFFPGSPQRATDRFRASIKAVQAGWPKARLVSWPLPGDPGFEIAAISAEATESSRRLLILTTGLHGVEGLIGSAILSLFVEEFAPLIDPASSGLCLIHPLNPWGMHHKRRSNGSNVDLNRNFLSSENGFKPPENHDYGRLRFLLEPTGEVGPIWQEKIRFLLRLGWGLLRLGPDRLLAATLEGQYQSPEGLYFGGQAPAPEAGWLRHTVQEHAADYDQVCWIDIHSGYGPRERMTIVDSPLESSEPADQEERFGYKPVIQAEASTFYEINGDMIDAAYRWFEADRETAPDFYATAFEFGTFGDSINASIRSLRAMVLENQLWFHGANNDRVQEWVAAEFLSLFYPVDPDWRGKAISDARQAFQGVLSAYGFIS